METKILSKGLTHISSDYSNLLRTNTSHFYLLIPDGSILLECGKHKTFVKKNELIVTKSIRITNTIESSRCNKIYFAYFFTEFNLDKIIRKPISVERIKTLLNLSDDFFDLSLENLNTNYLTHILEVCKSVNAVVNELKPNIGGKIDKRLIYINRYIRKKYNEYISLTTLASLINCSPVYLSNTYSQVFNISPLKHLQTIRIQKAKQLLSSSNLNCCEVAYSVGYSSPSQFSNIFKKVTGVSPYSYKKELLQFQEASK